jgi:excisionase family DNA binding protein
MKSYLSAAEVAKLLNVDRATVGRWLKKGLIDGAVSPSEGHKWRIPLASYEKLVREQKPNEDR